MPICVSFVQYFQLLLDNFQEVAEPYVFEKKNVLSGNIETVVIDNNINTQNSLSSHMKSYIASQLKVDEDTELVAIDEPLEYNTSGPDEFINEKSGHNVSNKTKR